MIPSISPLLSLSLALQQECDRHKMVRLYAERVGESIRGMDLRLGIKYRPTDGGGVITGFGIDLGRPGGDKTVISAVERRNGAIITRSITEKEPMSTAPHKYADVIKAWADGKALQWAHVPEPTYTDLLAQREPEWRDWSPDLSCAPTFDVGYLWRVKPEPKKWQKEREAFERGERVQWRSKSLQHMGMEWLEIPHGYRESPTSTALIFNEPTNEFRTPHKWQDVLDAQARGEKVEASSDCGKTWRFDPAIISYACDCPDWLYRVKPKTEKHRVRVALMMYGPGALVKGAIRIFTRTARSEEQARSVELSDEFVRWLGDWFEVEVPL